MDKVCTIHNRQALKKALAYAGDRANTAGHSRMAERSAKQYDPISAIPGSKSKAANASRKVRRKAGLYKV